MHESLADQLKKLKQLQRKLAKNDNREDEAVRDLADKLGIKYD